MKKGGSRCPSRKPRIRELPPERAGEELKQLRLRLPRAGTGCSTRPFGRAPTETKTSRASPADPVDLTAARIRKGPIPISDAAATKGTKPANGPQRRSNCSRGHAHHIAGNPRHRIPDTAFMTSANRWLLDHAPYRARPRHQADSSADRRRHRRHHPHDTKHPKGANVAANCDRLAARARATSTQSRS